MNSSPDQRNAKAGLHPRNRHRAGYDFPTLVRSTPSLAGFIRPSPAGADTIDFSDPAAVTALNRALLRHDYGISEWDIPPGYLCPPIPGRADYIHQAADLLANAAAIPRGSTVRVLDIGVGANCIYPIIGVSEYGWHFVGSDIDPVALASAGRLIAANQKLHGHVDLRLQRSPAAIFRGIMQPGETFALSLCNPPFHASRAAAATGSARKVRNLGGRKSTAPLRNFGGQRNELWCEGGESGFVGRMIAESAERPELCRWFTTLVSRRDSLPAIYRALRNVAAAEVRTIDLAHGQKKSRIVAWTFHRRRPDR